MLVGANNARTDQSRMTVPRELQGPETEGTILIEDDVLHSSDNEITDTKIQINLLCMLRLRIPTSRRD